jgi:hypothetical protein
MKKEEFRTIGMIKVFLFLYAWMVSVISYTAFNCPFIANNYTTIIVVNSLVLFVASFYLIGYINMRDYLRIVMKQAATRAEIRRQVEAEINKRLDEKK